MIILNLTNIKLTNYNYKMLMYQIDSFCPEIRFSMFSYLYLVVFIMPGGSKFYIFTNKFTWFIEILLTIDAIEHPQVESFS